MAQEIKELYEFGPFQLDASRRVVSRSGETLALTSKSFETLLLLLRNRERVLLKDEMMKALWPDTFVEEVNLAQNISALRKALGESPGENRYIATIPGKGYRFVGEVREGGDEAGDLILQRRTTSQVIIQEEVDDGKGSGALALPAPAANGRWVVAAIALLGAVVAAYAWKISRSAPEERIQSLAVLPFHSLSAGEGVSRGLNEDDEHLGLGVTDAIITKLSNLHQLSVRPTDVSLRYADPKADPANAAHEMGVDSLLTGKIQKSGDRLRVTVQLLRVRDGHPLWAQTFDDNFTNIFAVEDSISEKVVEALAVSLAAQEKKELARHYTENIEAYRNYLEGRYAEFTFTGAGMHQAIDYFDRAIALDPGYALAYAGLADAYTTESDWLIAPAEALPKAEAAARKALAFDENLAEGHAALAHVLLHEWRLKESDQEFQRALQLNSSNVTTQYEYAEYLASTGDEDRAIAEMNKALTIDPLSPEVNSFLAWDWYFKRDYDRCLSISMKAQQTFPKFWVPHLTAGMCYYIKGQYSQAIEEFQQARTMNPEATFPMTGLAISYAKAGDREKALAGAREMEQLGKQRYVAPVFIGIVYDVLGDRDAEFRWYEKAYYDRSEYLLWLTLDPVFDGVRSDPRFVELVKRVGVAR
ncbi:MAG TPA: winged helix-turn-helix domain-containing protein [Candidatus Solibacter sp.]|nr:winged helix-turn-helix domain-containing protein [Candidatus Solibacter sp.]